MPYLNNFRYNGHLVSVYVPYSALNSVLPESALQ
jgi:hypothetical protein